MFIWSDIFYLFVHVSCISINQSIISHIQCKTRIILHYIIFMPFCKYVMQKHKVEPSHKTHWATIISTSLAFSQTPVYTTRPLIVYGLAHHAVCLHC